MSGVPYALALLRYGDAAAGEAASRAGRAVVDRIARDDVGPGGLSRGEWRRESGWCTGWNPNRSWFHGRVACQETFGAH